MYSHAACMAEGRNHLPSVGAIDVFQLLLDPSTERGEVKAQRAGDPLIGAVRVHELLHEGADLLRGPPVVLQQGRVA